MDKEMNEQPALASQQTHAAHDFWAPQELLSTEVDRLTKALASLQTAHNELQTRAAQAEEQSIAALATKVLTSKLPEIITNEIEKQFNDFFDKEIERAVETAIAEHLGSCTIDCDEAVERAIEDALQHVEVRFNNYNR